MCPKEKNMRQSGILFFFVFLMMAVTGSVQAQEPEQKSRSDEKRRIQSTPIKQQPESILKQKTEPEPEKQHRKTRTYQDKETKDAKEPSRKEITRPTPSKREEERPDQEKQQFTLPPSLPPPGVKHEAPVTDHPWYSKPSVTKPDPATEAPTGGDTRTLKHPQSPAPREQTQPGTTSNPWYKTPQIPEGASPYRRQMPARSVEAPDLEPLPDLVIEDFDVRIYSDRQEGLTTKYPFTATIKNLGSEAVTEPFYVNFEHILGEEGSWWVNRTESRAIRINHEIGPSEELPLSHFVTLSTTEISDTPVQVRAVVDSAEFEEFPPAHGHILESNEDNNTSSAVLIPVRYRPIVTGINKTEAIKGLDEVMLTGMGLGTADPGRTVVMEKDGNKLGAEVRQWSQGGVVFRVPQTADTGLYQVYIGESSSFYPLSEESKFLMVFNRRELPWEQLMDGFNLFLTGAFSIRLHTWSGGSGYDNLSEMTVFGEKEPVSLMVPLIQFKTNMGYYRFLLNEMNTLGLNDEELGFSLKREACADNQLRLVILFENEGKEMIGYYKVLGPAGKWRRTGAPDVHVNNARIEILFQFVDAGLGNMDYQAAVTFSADVQASGSTWNTIIDLFMGGWDNNVKKKVATSVRQVINSAETRQKISQSLIGSIRLLAGLKKTDTITGYDFTSEAIQVTYF